jgi:vancomycin resistance protein YoaR
VALRFAVGFALGLSGALFIVGAVVFGLWRAYDGKILPGVRVGTVDVSGLTRDEAIARLDSEYASLGQGDVIVTTPGGEGRITYQEVGRGPDSTYMADAAFALGRAANPLASMVSTVRTFAVGGGIPVIVKLDSVALASSVRRLTTASLIPPRDASVAIAGAEHAILPAATGRGIDEVVIASELIDRLSRADTPAELQIDGESVTLEPKVTDVDAQAAAASIANMSVAVTLTNAGKTWTIDPATVHSWIVLGVGADGTYGPAVNPTPVKAFVATLAKEVNTSPVEPKVIYADGQPNGLSASKPGKALDVDGTAQNIVSYLDGLGSGGSTLGSDIAVVANDVQPRLASNPGLAGFVRIGQWATTYIPGESNGNGVNIQLPAELLNGLVVGPGQQFSFLQAAGPIDRAHGWKMGGVILNGKSDPTGAIGGGVCSASTTFFNAAARAGLQIDERHAHFYYINRYPVGLDATVFADSSRTWDMRWTNDTDNPIVIRSWWSGRSTRVIYVELWSLPLDRKTTFAGGIKTNIITAKDTTQYVPSLPPGKKTYRAEYPTDGYNTVVTRTVTAADGTVIHRDTWTSSYTKVDGLLQIAGTPPPSLGPTPSSASPPPAPVPTPSPTPSSASPPPAPVPTPSPTPLPPTPSPTSPPASLPPASTPSPPPSGRRPSRR